jgi:WD40 repeat protein
LYNTEDFSAEPGHIEVTGGLFSPIDNVLVSSGCDEPITLWDLAESRVIATLGEASYRCPELLAISPDGTMLLSEARSKMVNVWTIDGTDQPEPKFVLETGSALFLGAAFSPDTSVLATSSGKSIQLWDTATGQQITVLEGFDGSVYDVTFAPDSMILVAGTGYPDKLVRIWDISDPAAPRELAQLSFPAVDGVYNVAFNADGTFLAASSKTNFQIWEFFVEDNNVDYMPYLEVSGHKDDIRSLSFNPQQDLLLTSSLDQTTRVWNIHTGEQVAMMAGFMDTPILAYNHDGSLLAVAGEYEGANEAVVMLDC